MKETTQSEIELGLDIRFEVFRLVIEYLEAWDGTAESGRKTLEAAGEDADIELLAAADMLQINDLKMSCFESILRSVAPETSPERSVDIVQAGMLYALPQLEEAALFNLEHYGDTGALLAAVCKGYHDVVVALVQRLGPLWRQRGLLLAEEFFHAVSRGFPLDTLRAMLACSADLRKTVRGAADDRGNTAVHALCAMQQAAAAVTADFLLGAGADAAATNSQGATPMLVAAANNRADIVRILLIRGASPATADRAGNTPLHTAMERKHHGVARVLLEDPATPLDITNARGRRPLSSLVAGGKIAIEEMLKAWCADAPLLARRPAERVLHWLAQEHCFGLVPVIAESNGSSLIDIDSRDGQGDALVHKAVKDASVCGLRYLVAHGAKIDAPDRRGNTPLHLAILNGDIDCTRELLKQTTMIVSVATPNRRGSTPLHLLPLFIDDGPLFSPSQLQQQQSPQALSPTSPTIAASVPGTPSIGSFSRRKSEGSLLDQTALHRRSKSDTEESVEDATLSVFTLNHEAQSLAVAVHPLIADCHVELAELLIDSTHDGAKAAIAVNGFKSTPLHNAAAAHCIPMIRKLLAVTGIAINAVDNAGRTPLHLALLCESRTCSCAASISDVVTLLLASGADPSIQDRHGDNCLHIAVSHEAEGAILHNILSHAASTLINATNDAGDTPLMLAHRTNHRVAMGLLEEEQCRVQ